MAIVQASFSDLTQVLIAVVPKPKNTSSGTTQPNEGTRSW